MYNVSESKSICLTLMLMVYFDFDMEEVSEVERRYRQNCSMMETLEMQNRYLSVGVDWVRDNVFHYRALLEQPIDQNLAIDPSAICGHTFFL